MMHRRSYKKIELAVPCLVPGGISVQPDTGNRDGACLLHDSRRQYPEEAVSNLSGRKPW
jgi:hypothetical protein